MALLLFHRHRLGKISRLINIVALDPRRSLAKICSGTTVTKGIIRVGVVRGTQNTFSAYAAASLSPSSAIAMARAPRARTS